MTYWYIFQNKNISKRMKKLAIACCVLGLFACHKKETKEVSQLAIANYSGVKEQSSVVSEKLPKTSNSDAALVNWIELFELLNPPLAFEAQSDKDLKGSELSPDTLAYFFQADADYKPEHGYAIGRVVIAEGFSAYIIGIEGEYGMISCYLIPYNEAEKKPLAGMMLANREGDAGEDAIQKGWLEDFDQDGSVDIITRFGSTFLEIDADESERETSIEDAVLWNFSKSKQAFVQQAITNQEALNEKFVLEFE